MNKNRYSIQRALIFFLMLTFFSCGDSALSGEFIPKEKGRISSVEFKDGNARFTDSYLGIKQGRMEFDVKGDKVIIHDPMIGQLHFSIIDADTLSCDIAGMSGVYVRRK